ncbi:plasma kallikrein-like [Ornithodoros turicata]|uniref:plasma kallikrein-like n=1 Tax=Ornithodoros turicata TaxID=34597 RepID=UPI0031393737
MKGILVLCGLLLPVCCQGRGLASLDSVEACNHGVTSNLSQAYLRSPRYDIDPEAAPLQRRCSWTIVSTKPEKVVKLSSEFFVLSCKNNYTLDVYDGVNSTAQPIGRFCGGAFPSDVVSSGPALHVEFEYEYLTSHQGFMLFFSVELPDVECPSELLTCRNRKHCFKKESQCDGIDDCQDGTDEEDCDKPKDAPETKCGLRPSTPPVDRIVGGQVARPGSWPWIAMLRVPETEPYGFQCAATLIAPEWLVTAAHCFRDFRDSEDWSVSLNRYGSLLQEDDAVVRYVRKIIVHPDYNGFKPWNHTTPWLWRKQHDLALVQMNAPVNTSEFVRTICLPKPDFDPTAGLSCMAAGWGVTLNDEESREFLREVALPVITRDVCQEQLPEYTIAESMICAGHEDGGRDTCSGDSGGPLMYEAEEGWTLAGVVSTGSGCAHAKKPGVLSSIAYYVPWILEVVEGGVTANTV